MASEACAVDSSQDKPLYHLNQIAKRPKLDIKFQDLTYSLRESSVKGGWLQILHSINGEFRHGELTAILGPSGSGKTTLLNILTGYVRGGVQGSIKINNHPRDDRIFHKLSALIMQEDIIQPHLTVKEAMNYAACLKLGSHISRQDKVAVVEEVLNFLGMENAKNTYSEYLSSGERKRLSVSLELVNNPPVIFLDEPTTGLDNFAIKQCIDFLKKITNLDRTVVCTIHQPPSSLFQVFDQVYILANGHCVYNGAPTQFVPFLDLADYSCPSNYTPAEYMIELVYSDPSTIDHFKTITQNGKVNMTESRSEEPNAEISTNEELYNGFVQVFEKSDLEYATSYKTQLLILTSRMFLQASRNYIGLAIQIVHHLAGGLLIGGTFLGIGNNANEIFTILKFCVSCVVYIMYTHAMIPVLLVPFQLPVLKRESFNRWYSLKAYYSAWTVANAPLVTILSIIFTAFSYFLSDQPQDTSRFVGFCLLILSISATSQSFGFLIGAAFNSCNGSIAAPILMAAFLAVGIHGMGFESNIPTFYKILMSLSFVRNGLVGLTCVLFYKRERLGCYGDISDCPYTQGDIILKRMSVPISDYKYHLGCMCMFLVLFKVLGYVALRCRLNVELYSRIKYHLKKTIVVNCKWKDNFMKNKKFLSNKTNS